MVLLKEYHCLNVKHVLKVNDVMGGLLVISYIRVVINDILQLMNVTALYKYINVYLSVFDETT